MRVLKSWLLWVLVCTTAAQAQDTATIARDNSAVFRADKIAAVTTWKERSVPDTTLKRLRSDDAFWYANANLKKKAAAPGKEAGSFWQKLFAQAWFYNLLWAIIIVSFVAVIVVFLLKSNISLFQKKAAVIRENNLSEPAEDIFSIDYDKALRDAVAANDLPAAIRFQYLHTLTVLCAKKLIHYSSEHTNADYLLQLQHTPYYGGFKKLTRHFEYAWYGKFAVTSPMYEAIAQDFATFKNSMGV